MTDLDNLIEAVEAGCDHSEKWRPALGEHAYIGMTAFHGSLDAANELHEGLLPGWGWEAGENATFVSISQVWKSGRDAAISANADAPARAWLLAILKAYRTTQDASK